MASGLVRVTISRGAVFVREPVGGTVITGRGVDPVNEDGARIFEAICRGDYSAVESFYRESPEEVAGFIVEAKKKGYIDVSLRIPFRGSGSGGRCVWLDYFLPYTLTVEATFRCNARCPYCYLGQHLSGEVLDVEALTGWLEAIGGDIGVREGFIAAVDVSGGDPLLHPRFEELLRSLLRFSRRATVITNGTLLGSYVDLFASLRDRVSVQVSVDSLRPDVYARAKGVNPSVLGEVLEAVEELANRGVRVVVAVPVSKTNIGFVGETVEGLKRRFGGSIGIRVSPVLAVGDADPEYAFGPGELEKVKDKLAGFASRPEKLVDVEEVEALIETMGSCGAGWKRVAVGADGAVRPCPLFPRGIVLGSIREPPSRVLGSRLARAFASAPRPGGFTCKGCRYQSWCAGCMARAVEKALQGVPCLWARKHLPGLLSGRGL